MYVQKTNADSNFYLLIILITTLMNKKRKTEHESSLKKEPEYGNPEYTSEEDIYSKSKKILFDEEGRDTSQN